MDLQAIAQIQATRKNLDQKRHEQAEKLVAQAFAALNQALDPRFVSAKATLLENACDRFGDALQYHRQNPEIYIGLGYLSILLQDYAQARNYLDEGLRLAPDNPDLAQMLHYLDQRPAPPAARPESEAPADLPHAFVLPRLPVASLSEADYDSLYDETEAGIVEAVKAVMQVPLPIKPNVQTTQDTQFQASYAHWTQVHKDLKRALQILDQEMDTSELQQQLHALEVFLRRCQHLLASAAEIQAVQVQLQNLQQQVKTCYQQLATASRQGQQIEALLDACDLTADQLDAFEAKGYDVPELIRAYEALVLQIDQLQEALEDQD